MTEILTERVQNDLAELTRRMVESSSMYNNIRLIPEGIGSLIGPVFEIENRSTFIDESTRLILKISGIQSLAELLNHEYREKIRISGEFCSEKVDGTIGYIDFDAFPFNPQLKCPLNYFKESYRILDGINQITEFLINIDGRGIIRITSQDGEINETVNLEYGDILKRAFFTVAWMLSCVDPIKEEQIAQ